MDIVRSFTIPPRPIDADHTYLSFFLRTSSSTPSPPSPTEHTTIHFRISQLDPDASLSALTTELITILHLAALESFPSTTHSTDTPQSGTMPQNRWYDDECRQLYQRLRAEHITEQISERQMRRQMGTLTRRKRRAFEETVVGCIPRTSESRGSDLLERHAIADPTHTYRGPSDMACICRDIISGTSPAPTATPRGPATCSSHSLYHRHGETRHSESTAPPSCGPHRASG
ncbi:hypothetical protein L7F22_064479 [Adiantum nelumboides]|nr:hypothetical protein [Adiantum nelumboides]